MCQVIPSESLKKRFPDDPKSARRTVSHFKFQLDQTVNHLEDFFPAKRVVTNKTLGFRQEMPDEELVAYASLNGHLLVTANRRDFERDAKACVAQSSKKPNGCSRVPGLILLFSNDEIVQRRMLTGLENRLSFEGKKITYKDIHDRDLLVKVHSTGEAIISRLPRCPHCEYEDEK